MRQSMLVFAVSLLALAAMGCRPKLGDGCTTDLDCSVNGDRQCDRSQPGGYCTIANCEPDSCGEEGICVRFNPDELRLSSDWCMAKCSETGDCDRDRYVCRTTEDLKGPNPEPGAPEVAEVLGAGKNRKFCVLEE